MSSILFSELSGIRILLLPFILYRLGLVRW